MHTWYCSVSLRWNTVLAGGASASSTRGRGLRDGSGAFFFAWPRIRPTSRS